MAGSSTSHGDLQHPGAHLRAQLGRPSHPHSTKRLTGQQRLRPRFRHPRLGSPKRKNGMEKRQTHILLDLYINRKIYVGMIAYGATRKQGCIETLLDLYSTCASKPLQKKDSDLLFVRAGVATSVRKAFERRRGGGILPCAHACHNNPSKPSTPPALLPSMRPLEQTLQYQGAAKKQRQTTGRRIYYHVGSSVCSCVTMSTAAAVSPERELKVSASKQQEGNPAASICT